MQVDQLVPWDEKYDENLEERPAPQAEYTLEIVDAKRKIKNGDENSSSPQINLSILVRITGHDQENFSPIFLTFPEVHSDDDAQQTIRKQRRMSRLYYWFDLPRGEGVTTEQYKGHRSIVPLVVKNEIARVRDDETGQWGPDPDGRVVNNLELPPRPGQTQPSKGSRKKIEAI